MSSEVTTLLKCPRCGRDGTALWQRNAHIRRGPRSLLTFSAGFHSIDDGSKDAPHFRCATCKVLAIETGETTPLFETGGLGGSAAR